MVLLPSIHPKKTSHQLPAAPNPPTPHPRLWVGREGEGEGETRGFPLRSALGASWQDAAAELQLGPDNGCFLGSATLLLTQATCVYSFMAFVG